MPADFHRMEETLKSYLCDELADSYNKSGQGYYKYNNLKVYMDPKKSHRPHFIVRIGMSEAMYDLLSYEKLLGGLGAEGKYVKRWAERYLSHDDLSIAWVTSNKLELVDAADVVELSD